MTLITDSVELQNLPIEEEEEIYENAQNNEFMEEDQQEFPEEEQQYFLEEEDFDYPFTHFSCHKRVLENYLNSTNPQDADEIRNYLATDPKETYNGLVKVFGPKLLQNSDQIQKLKAKRDERNNDERPERMTNDQLRDSIKNLNDTIGALDQEMVTLRDDIEVLKEQFATYQQKKKEREMAAMTSHARKSAGKTSKATTAATPSPNKKKLKK